MSGILQKIRDAVAGKKTYITAIIGILTALVAWAGGELTDWQAITAVWIALQIIFVRAGNKQDVANRVDVLNVRVVEDAYDTGFADGHEGTYVRGFTNGYDDGFEDGYYEDE